MQSGFCADAGFAFASRKSGDYRAQLWIDPERVGELGAAFARGLAAEGILGCAKHFPGHGDAAVDPHLDLPIFEGTLERLRGMELLPFAEAIKAGVPTVMTAHILLPWIDPVRPATLSRRVVENLLRQELNFKRVVLADDLGMGAIAKQFPAGAAAVECFRAGAILRCFAMIGRW